METELLIVPTKNYVENKKWWWWWLEGWQRELLKAPFPFLFPTKSELAVTLVEERNYTDAGFDVFLPREQEGQQQRWSHDHEDDEPVGHHLANPQCKNHHWSTGTNPNTNCQGSVLPNPSYISCQEIMRPFLKVKTRIIIRAPFDSSSSSLKGTVVLSQYCWPDHGTFFYLTVVLSISPSSLVLIAIPVLKISLDM